MPASLTYWRILIETARKTQNTGNDLGPLIVDATALRRRAHGWSTPPQTTAASGIWNTGPFPEIDFRFPGSDIPAMAFLGALAPDVMYYHRCYFREKLTDAHLCKPHPGTPGLKCPQQWSELFHCSHSGDILIVFLEQVALVPSPALRSQALAFALGYASHIAANLALNPWTDTVASRLPAHHMPGSHFYVELRLDEHLATTYFDHPRYSLFYQPWGRYIGPVIRSLNRPGSLASQILQLLAIAAEIYNLSEEQTESLPQDFLEGLKGLQRFLEGRGRARWLVLQAAQRRGPHDLIGQILLNTQNDAQIVSLEKVLHYAFRLSERFCQQAINYYTTLRNPNAKASERSSQRTALASDLRNWNLYTGSATDDSERAHTPHNWIYFADLWEQNEEEQLAQQLRQENR